MDIYRIKQLAGLIENSLIPNQNGLQGEIDDQDEHEQDMARYDRETKVRSIIKYSFKKIGIKINTDANLSDGIFYSEEDDREAIVSLYENEIDIDLLIRLKQSGLAEKFIVEAGSHELDIKFNVSPEIDNVVMKGK